jgi:hypothetical protein
MRALPEDVCQISIIAPNLASVAECATLYLPTMPAYLGRLFLCLARNLK